MKNKTRILWILVILSFLIITVTLYIALKSSWIHTDYFLYPSDCSEFNIKTSSGCYVYIPDNSLGKFVYFNNLYIPFMKLHFLSWGILICSILLLLRVEK